MEETCHEHTGCIARIKAVEEDVISLFHKWDRIQGLLIGTLVSGILCLIGVIAVFLKG